MTLSATEKTALEQVAKGLSSVASWTSGPRANQVEQLRQKVQAVLDGEVDEAAVKEQAAADQRAADQAAQLEAERKAEEAAQKAAEKAREKAAAKQS